ncbi:MAG: dihydroneopterin aldolase [Myxococcota bacterium]|nr:dihydroneopterin aldolase [Myxococcota bacterium]
MTINVDNLEVDCLIGVWSHERNIAQRIRVDIAVECDVETAAREDDLPLTLNYADIARDVTFILEKCQFHLLESAVCAIQHWLLLPALSPTKPKITAVDVKLTKFSALPGSTLASVQGRRSSEQVDYVREDKEWGHVDVVYETKRVGIYRLNIAAGKSLPAHHHEVMREVELVLNHGLEVFGPEQVRTVLETGQSLSWPMGHVHGYENHSTTVASLLCIDDPPFIPEDERVWGSV